MASTWWSQPLITPVPGDPPPFSRLHGHYTHIKHHTHKINNNFLNKVKINSEDSTEVYADKDRSSRVHFACVHTPQSLS